ncbi:hypothetical protein CCAX7_41360 [Capsulimonas corticalis]|uniref:Glycoside hydrolase 123-like N-terminal domain-containing protein n=1 Tax=Capsulimonas corticalis TaxID=2219043 RepID=A0A402D789_9BACT|nr:glycoside hydrolase domain-containing protein [Capsulimonas corticalis]BDI32085.1 hypothetical protein CCAX7_41360 [Capsulimonas corticalis]
MQRPNTIVYFTLTSLLALAAMPRPAGAAVADGYKAPQIAVPYAWSKPTLDGEIHEDEWRGAESINTLQTPDHTLGSRPTRFWMMWDADNLYVAMRSPLRPGERLIQALRDPSKDVNAVMDDSYEFWLDAGSHSPDGQPVFFQYLGNFAGARWDVMQEPAAGNSRPSWTAHWSPKNHLTVGPDGARYWDMELAIPRASVYIDQPFQDGFSFTALLSRNFKRPWEQNSIPGTGSFSVPDTYAQYKLIKQAPAVHLLAAGDEKTKTLGLALAAWSPKDQTLHWRYDSDGGVHKEGDLAVKAGQDLAPASMLDLDKPGDGAFRIRVTSADGAQTYLDWSAHRQWGDDSALTQKLNDTGDKVDLTLGYNPARDYVRVTGDFIQYDDRAKIARAHVAVRDSQNMTLAEKDVHLDSLAYVRDLLQLPNVPGGDYTAQLTAYDGANHILFTRDSKFTKKDPTSFPWWNTKLGDIEKVIAPWTPVSYQAGTFGVWGRTMKVGAAGLPSQMTAQGHDLFAGGAYLAADFGSGAPVRTGASALTTLSSSAHRVVVRADDRLGKISVSSKVTTEFDGMYKVEMTLTPHGSVSVNSLKLVVPLRNDAANYLHACGEGIRYGFDDRFLPQGKTGALWDSRRVDGQPMLVGSFIPYLWIGNPERGVCWFADSDQGWVPSNQIPAIEIRRDSPGSTDLVLNLIGGKFTLTTPRTITFAFQATPVKPMPEHWRMDTWWTGDSFKDWAQIESEGKAGAMGLIFSSLPFPLDPPKSHEMVEARHKESNATIFGFDKYRANAVPYFEHINMGEQFVPELTYFNEEWRTRVSRGLSYGKTLSDFMIYKLSHWVQDADIDGFYVDNVFPIADDNIDSGHGYRLPDGRVQPAYQMFDTRRYFLRMRAAFAERGKSGKIVLHMTNHLIAPWMGAADIALDGEHHVIYPEMGKDFMDFWSQERLRMDHPEQWGSPVNFLQEYQGSWDHDVLKKAMRAYTGMLLVNDVLASANANSLNQEAWIARDHFGMESSDVQFHGYWDPANGLKCAAPSVFVSGWTRPGKALIVAANMGEKTGAAVRIDAKALGLPASSHWKVSDAETGQALSAGSDGQVTLAIERHDYRQIVIETGE